MRILFQGDSITDCYRVKEGDGLDLRMGMGYATMCQAELMYEEPGKYVVMNRGINGNRVPDIYARMQEDIIDLKPDVMSILIGINDAGHMFDDISNPPDADEYFKVYSKLIEDVKAALPDIKIMIMGPFCEKGKVNEQFWPEYKVEAIKRAEMAKKVAEKYDLTFIPLQDKFDEALERGNEACWFWDGIHPTSAGHFIIKKEWMKAFKALNL